MKLIDLFERVIVINVFYVYILIIKVILLIIILKFREIFKKEFRNIRIFNKIIYLLVVIFFMFEDLFVL